VTQARCIIHVVKLLTRFAGNCLFRSLSTTLYGHDGEYRSIRAKVVNYIGDHANEYMMFIPYNPGGGLRRNPKRKTTGAYSAPDTAPTAAERRTYFDRYVAKMAEEGTYATEVEIVAFTKAFDRSVVVYHYAGNEIPYTAGGGSRPTSHVAYHVSKPDMASMLQLTLG
jgi:OTU domain-containing protein 3